MSKFHSAVEWFFSLTVEPEFIIGQMRQMRLNYNIPNSAIKWWYKLQPVQIANYRIVLQHQRRNSDLFSIALTPYFSAPQNHLRYEYRASEKLSIFNAPTMIKWCQCKLFTRPWSNNKLVTHRWHCCNNTDVAIICVNDGWFDGSSSFLMVLREDYWCLRDSTVTGGRCALKFN